MTWLMFFFGELSRQPLGVAAAVPPSRVAPSASNATATATEFSEMLSAGLSPATRL
jgi:hypothetical protein